MDRRGDGRAKGPASRVRGMPAKNERPLVSVIMLSTCVERARRALEAVRSHTPAGLAHTTVSVNGGADGVPHSDAPGLLSPVADHVLLDPTAFSFSAHNNHAVREAEMWLGYTTAFLCFLNDDVIVRRGWLEDMLACYAQEDACAVGMKLVYPDYMDLAGRIQHCGVERGPFRTGAHRGVCADPDSPPFSEPRWVRTWAVTGACLLVSSEDFWTYGPFDKGYEDESQDTDLCMRLKHGTGSDCYVVQSNHCWHEELATRGPVTSASLVGGDPGESVDAMAVLTRRLRDTARFIERWGSED